MGGYWAHLVAEVFGHGVEVFNAVFLIALRRARELVRVCTAKVTQPPAAGGEDNALHCCVLAAAAMWPGWVSFAARRAMFHWTGSKIQVYAFYCVLSLLLTSPPQRELARKGESLSINRMLEELGGIRETMIVYPRRQGQRKAPTATCLTRTRATPILAPKPAVFLPSLPLGHTPHSLQVILLARLIQHLARNL